MAFLTASRQWSAMLEALGIDPKTVRGFEIRAFVGEVSTMDVHTYLQIEAVDKIEESVKHFKLVPIEEDAIALP